MNDGREFSCGSLRGGIICLAGALLVLLFYTLGWTESFDKSGLEWMVSIRSPGLTNRVMELSALGSLPVLVLIGMATTLYLSTRGEQKTTARVFFIMVSAEIVAYVAKHLVARTRPEEFFADGVRGSIGSDLNVSFPSGHSMMSAAMYLCIALLLHNAAGRRHSQRALVGGTLALIFLIGLSRVYLGVHNPSDVLAGWLGGTGWTLAWFAFFDRRDQRAGPARTEAA